MKLLIKQRVFSWADTYDVYDENENPKYYVEAKLLSIGHQLHVYDRNCNEIGVIKEKIMTFLPQFDIEIGGRYVGNIQQKFTLFYPKYEIDYNGWRVDGDFLGFFKLVKVHQSRSVLNLAHSVDYAAVKKHSFAKGGLALAAVPDNRNVADFLSSNIHFFKSPYRLLAAVAAGNAVINIIII